MHELVRSVHAMRDDLVGLTCDLVRIPSVNPYSGDNTAGNELKAQLYFKEQLEKRLGAVTRLSEPPSDIYKRAGFVGPEGRSWKDRPNLTGEVKFGNGQGKTIVLNAHMDTVGAEGMKDPFSAKIEDGKIWGRGTSDTKGNLAVGVIALRALLSSPLANECSGKVILESVVDEECNGGGAGTMWCCLEGVRGDYAICLDGGGPDVYVGCNGILTVDLRVPGRSGHSSRGGTVNAIDNAVYLKGAIDNFKKRRTAEKPSARVDLAIFRAGHVHAMTPGSATLGLNIGYDAAEAADAEKNGKGWSADCVKRMFTDAILSASKEHDFLRDNPPEFQIVKDVYPYATPTDLPLVAAACSALAEVKGADVKPRVLEAWCDASHLSRLGKMPTVGLASGTPGTPHTATEYAEIDRLRDGAAAVALLLYTLLKK